jgi:hypothetical protein
MFLYIDIRSLVEINCLRSLSHSVALQSISLSYRGPYRPFGENQLSPGSVGILPLTTSRPTLLQQRRVRASLLISQKFTLLEVRSPGFGSAAWYLFSPYSDSVSLCFHWSPNLCCTKRQLAGSFFNRHEITTINCSSLGLFANSFRFYFTGRSALLLTFPSRY